MIEPRWRRGRPEPVALGLESMVTALLAKLGFFAKGTISTSPKNFTEKKYDTINHSISDRNEC